MYVISIVNAAREILAFVDGMLGPSTRAARIGHDGRRALQSSRARMVRVWYAYFESNLFMYLNQIF